MNDLVAGYVRRYGKRGLRYLVERRIDLVGEAIRRVPMLSRALYIARRSGVAREVTVEWLYGEILRVLRENGVDSLTPDEEEYLWGIARKIKALLG